LPVWPAAFRLGGYENASPHEVCHATEEAPLPQVRREAQQPGEAVQAVHGSSRQTAEIVGALPMTKHQASNHKQILKYKFK
jgi:hypothetical protein